MSPFRSSAARAIAARGARASASVQRTGNRGGEHGIRRHAPAHRVLVVFRLGDQVGRDPRRAGRSVGDDEHLGRPGDHVDPHLPHDLPLRLGDPPAPRSDDLVHPRHGRRAERERGHRLRPADPEDPGDARERAGGEHDVVHAGGRDHGHDLAHAGHDGGNRIHDDRRRVRGLSARDVQADPVQRRHPHTDQGSFRLEREPRFPLVLVVLPHPVHRQRERRPERGGNAIHRPLPRGGVQLPLGGGQVHTVEQTGILPDGLVPPSHHAFDDGGNRVACGGVAPTALRQQGVERLEGRHVEGADQPHGSR